MGGFGAAVSSPMMQYGMQGLATGMQTGSGIANAMYNAAAARMQAKAINEQSDLQAYLIREQYNAEYKQLKQSQEVTQSMNRVMQAKHGIVGASANAVMQSYAAKAQRNLETLYYNAAMATGKQSLAASAQREAMLEKARQYDWKAWQTGVAGVVGFGAGMLNEYARDIEGTTTKKAYSGLEKGQPDVATAGFANDNPAEWYLEMHDPERPMLDLSGLVVTPLTE